MERIIIILIALLITACQNTEHEYKYYPNGNLMMDIEKLNGKRDGVLLEYYETGKLKLRQEWRDGRLNGRTEEFYPNGNIAKRGYVENFIMTSMIYYYESGVVKQVHHYDYEGLVSEIERFKSDGTRDSIPFPLIYLNDGDTIVKSTPATLKARILNAIDPLYRNGRLIITSGFDTLDDEDIVVKDTIQMVYPSDKTKYTYVFLPKKIGIDTIYGKFIFSIDEGDFESIAIHNFRYLYVAKE